jgi:hypothetical protein
MSGQFRRNIKSSKLRKSRKERTCDLCGKIIRVGEKYAPFGQYHHVEGGRFVHCEECK